MGARILFAAVRGSRRNKAGTQTMFRGKAYWREFCFFSCDVMRRGCEYGNHRGWRRSSAGKAPDDMCKIRLVANQSWRSWAASLSGGFALVELQSGGPHSQPTERERALERPLPSRKDGLRLTPPANVRPCGRRRVFRPVGSRSHCSSPNSLVRVFDVSGHAKRRHP